MPYDLELTPLLETCTQDELDPIVKYILTKGHWTEALSRTAQYDANKPDHTKYIDLIVNEFRRFGGNTLLNVIRGDGVSYSEILGDVARKVGVERRKRRAPTAEVEVQVILKILERMEKHLTPEERQEFLRLLQSFAGDFVPRNVAVPISILLAQLAAKLGPQITFRFATLIAEIIARQLLKGGIQSVITDAVLARFLSIAGGPVAIALTALWAAIDVAGPAYRVTVPAVCHVAHLRQKRLFEDMGGT